MQIFCFCLRFLFEAILPSHLGMQPHGVTLDYKFHVINPVISDKIKEPTIPQHMSFVQRRLTYFGQYTGPNSYLKYYTLKCRRSLYMAQNSSNVCDFVNNICFCFMFTTLCHASVSFMVNIMKTVVTIPVVPYIILYP